MNKTPRPILDIQQMFSCARRTATSAASESREIFVAIRGMRGGKDGKRGEPFELALSVDIDRLRDLRGLRRD